MSTRLVEQVCIGRDFQRKANRGLSRFVCAFCLFFVVFHNFIEMSTWAPEQFSILSWNLDGLDSKNLEKRTEAVVDLVEKEDYSILFFQEMLPTTFDYVAKRLLSKYLPIVGTDDPSCGYLVATFLRLNHIIYEDHNIVKYPNTSMDRNVLVTKAFSGSAKLCLLNTHLESTADFAEERVNQLQTCFNLCRSFPSEYNVIFGGDLNLRDKEVSGRIPSNMCDLWEKCGSRSSARFTWDLKRNTNKQMPSKYQPSCRFDRLYFRNSDPMTIKPEFFGVTGMEKVAGTQSFPSDHWGIISFFRLEHEARKPQSRKRKAENSDGSLRDGHDVANMASLSAVTRAEVSKEVSLFRATTAPPPSDSNPFAGRGQMLGSPAPTTVGSTGPASENDRKANENTAQSQVKISEDEPTTNITFRLVDGTRVLARFNHSHTVNDLYQFVNTARPQLASTNYVLTFFPNNELTKREATVKEANILNSALIQKIK